jgi:hypothetical protein
MTKPEPTDERKPKTPPEPFLPDGTLLYPEDLTGRLYQLFGKKPEITEKDGYVVIPMYSYDRPSAYLWQAVFDEMVKRGATHAEAIDWLKSKGPRHWLDERGGSDGPIVALGRSIAAEVMFSPSARPTQTSAHEFLAAYSAIPEEKRALALDILRIHGLIER